MGYEPADALIKAIRVPECLFWTNIHKDNPTGCLISHLPANHDAPKHKLCRLAPSTSNKDASYMVL